MGGVGGNSQTQGISAERLGAFREVLADAVRVAEEEGIDYLIGGSIASGTWGRPASVGDIDMVISPVDAKRLLKAFEQAGYDTEVHDPRWIYKAKKDEIVVDLIFELEGAVYLEDEMVARGPIREVHGVRLRLMAPEDFVVSQALSTKEDTPDYWYNALGVIARTPLDWDYLIDRASRGPRRLLSLLIFAQSEDLVVPDTVLKRMFDATYGG